MRPAPLTLLLICDETTSVRFADYRADGFAQDTRKFWLQLDWTI